MLSSVFLKPFHVATWVDLSRTLRFNFLLVQVVQLFLLNGDCITYDRTSDRLLDHGVIGTTLSNSILIQMLLTIVQFFWRCLIRMYLIIFCFCL